jgi:hypothetical protein
MHPVASFARLGVFFSTLHMWTSQLWFPIQLLFVCTSTSVHESRTLCRLLSRQEIWTFGLHDFRKKANSQTFQSRNLFCLHFITKIKSFGRIKEQKKKLSVIFTYKIESLRCHSSREKSVFALLMNQTLARTYKFLATDKQTKQSPWPESTSELYQPSDRRLSAKLVPAFLDRRVSRSQRGRSPTVVISVF